MLDRDHTRVVLLVAPRTALGSAQLDQRNDHKPGARFRPTPAALRGSSRQRPRGEQDKRRNYARTRRPSVGSEEISYDLASALSCFKLFQKVNLALSCPRHYPSVAGDLVASRNRVGDGLAISVRSFERGDDSGAMRMSVIFRVWAAGGP